MRKIEAEEAARLGLPPHEHHDLPKNKGVLDTMANSPGSWFHFTWEELGAVGTHDEKLQALLYDQEFRRWKMHNYIVNGYADGGVFLMRDLME